MTIANGSPLCPVYSFEKYLSHLNPLNEFLFQRPKSNTSSGREIWYDNMVVAANTLGNKMKCISKEANLSLQYTNHSIRATTITILDRNGYEARHIMTVSGHRNEGSIKSYSKTDETTKNKMASRLMSVVASTNNNDLPENLATASPAVTTCTSGTLDLDILTSSQEERIIKAQLSQQNNSTVKLTFMARVFMRY